jgi:hypothetical protein
MLCLIQLNLYPSFLKGLQKINDECGKVIYFELVGENCMKITDLWINNILL